MRTRLLAVFALALCAQPVEAGEVTILSWPGGNVPQEVAEIPVAMDIPWWVWITDLDKLVIRLTPRSVHEYEGCIDIAYQTRGNLHVSAEFTPNGAVPGDYSCLLSSSLLDAPGGNLGACVRLNVETLPPAMTDVRVGTVTLKISAR